MFADSAKTSGADAPSTSTVSKGDFPSGCISFISGGASMRFRL